MKVAAAVLALANVALVAEADIFMHNPHGSNNRNCRIDGQKARRNNNRLFDSQNNNNGGYPCQRAMPYACYELRENDEAFAACVDQGSGTKDAVDSNGDLTDPSAVNTPMMYYHSGSVLRVEWTVQHGLGPNPELHSQVVLQYSCEDLLEDNCGEEIVAPAGQCKSPFVADSAINKKCGPRDGTPNRLTGDRLDTEATDSLPEDNESQDDYRYGRHESLNYLRQCNNRKRNGGLFIADQNVPLNRNAQHTRQNPGGGESGFECAEESEYWPYWHHSPFIDIAVLAEDTSQCEFYQTESQNVKPRHRCDCGGECDGNANQPNNEEDCLREGFVWCEDPAHDKPEPECIEADVNRQNHLGNVGDTLGTNAYNWTIPEVETPQKCFLRIRYNISTGDANDISVSGTFADSEGATPIFDNDENEPLTYMGIEGLGLSGDQVKLGFAINTDQYGRTFQDRSYMFEIRPAPEDGDCDGRDIHNLNVRGKRGNIVQTYPAVEYDFVPTELVVKDSDCVHVQWTGTDYNQDQDGNNGEGGPCAANEQACKTKSDRSNIAQLAKASDNTPFLDIEQYDMFDISAEQWKRLLFLDQEIDNPAVCLDFDALNARYNTRAEREETHLNCMKLSGAKTPYFDLGPVRAGARGVHHYMSTRNNNFSNRGQKGTLVIERNLSTGAIMGITIAVLGAAVLGGAFFIHRRRQEQERTMYGGNITKGGVVSHPQGAASTTSAAARAAGAAGMFSGAITSMWKGGGSASGDQSEFVQAVHYHEAKEPGELAFQKGDKVRVLSKDASGWWEGEINGNRGIFPANFTKPV